MDSHAVEDDPLPSASPKLERVFGGNAELVRFASRRNFVVSPRRDVGRKTQGYRGESALLLGNLAQASQLRFRFDIDVAHALLQGRAKLEVAFADTRKDDALRINAARQRAQHLTLGDDVEAAAHPGKRLQHAQTVVRLHRVSY